MTTLAFDGRYLVSDGRSCTNDGMICGRQEKKIFPLKISLGGIETEVVFATSGSSVSIESFLRWVALGGDMIDNEQSFSLFNTHPNPDEHNVGIIMVERKTGKVSLIDEQLVPFEVEYPLAGGSGTPFATTAMSCGMNAVQATYKAMEWDSNSGGLVRAFDTKTWDWVDADTLKGSFLV